MSKKGIDIFSNKDRKRYNELKKYIDTKDYSSLIENDIDDNFGFDNKRYTNKIISILSLIAASNTDMLLIMYKKEYKRFNYFYEEGIKNNSSIIINLINKIPSIEHELIIFAIKNGFMPSEDYIISHYISFRDSNIMKELISNGFILNPLLIENERFYDVFKDENLLLEVTKNGYVPSMEFIIKTGALRNKEILEILFDKLDFNEDNINSKVFIGNKELQRKIIITKPELIFNLDKNNITYIPFFIGAIDLDYIDEKILKDHEEIRTNFELMKLLVLKNPKFINYALLNDEEKELLVDYFIISESDISLLDVNSSFVNSSFKLMKKLIEYNPNNIKYIERRDYDSFKPTILEIDKFNSLCRLSLSNGYIPNIKDALYNPRLFDNYEILNLLIMDDASLITKVRKLTYNKEALLECAYEYGFNNDLPKYYDELDYVYATPDMFNELLVSESYIKHILNNGNRLNDNFKYKNNYSFDLYKLLIENDYKYKDIYKMFTNSSLDTIKEIINLEPSFINKINTDNLLYEEKEALRYIVASKGQDIKDDNISINNPLIEEYDIKKEELKKEIIDNYLSENITSRLTNNQIEILSYYPNIQKDILSISKDSIKGSILFKAIDECKNNTKLVNTITKIISNLKNPVYYNLIYDLKDRKLSNELYKVLINLLLSDNHLNISSYNELSDYDNIRTNYINNLIKEGSLISIKKAILESIYNMGIFESIKLINDENISNIINTNDKKILKELLENKQINNYQDKIKNKFITSINNSLYNFNDEDSINYKDYEIYVLKGKFNLLISPINMYNDKVIKTSYINNSYIETYKNKNIYFSFNDIEDINNDYLLNTIIIKDNQVYKKEAYSLVYICDNYKDSDPLFKKVLNLSKEFSHVVNGLKKHLPIIIIERENILIKEKDIILESFSKYKETHDENLINDIVIRYESNYIGLKNYKGNLKNKYFKKYDKFKNSMVGLLIDEIDKLSIYSIDKSYKGITKLEESISYLEDKYDINDLSFQIELAKEKISRIKDRFLMKNYSVINISTISEKNTREYIKYDFPKMESGMLKEELSSEDVMSILESNDLYKSIIIKENEVREEGINHRLNNHGSRHISNVILFSSIIGSCVLNDKHDIELLIEASKYHDIGRTNDKEEPNYLLSSKIAKEKLKDLYSLEDLAYILTTIETFNVDLDKESILNISIKNGVKDITKINMFRTILKDSNLLDRTRYINKLRLNPNMLSLDISKHLIKYASSINETYSLNELDNYKCPKEIKTLLKEYTPSELLREIKHNTRGKKEEAIKLYISKMIKG